MSVIKRKGFAMIMAIFVVVMVALGGTLLLSNAAKFAPFESEVELIVSYGADFVEIKVIDQGQGMTQQEQSLLFTERCRILPMDKSQGTGMGLYFTKRLIDRMAGQVWCNSVAEKGTCFSIRLGKAITH